MEIITPFPIVAASLLYGETIAKAEVFSGLLQATKPGLSQTLLAPVSSNISS